MDKIKFNRIDAVQAAREFKAEELIKAEAWRMADLFGGAAGGDCIEVFIEPLMTCYQRGLDDAMIMVANKVMELMNVGTDGIAHLDKRLGWVPKESA